MSRPCVAAILASAAACDLRMMSLPSAGLRSNQSPNRSLRTFCMNDLALGAAGVSGFGLASNCGSASLMEMMASGLADVVAGDPVLLLLHQTLARLPAVHGVDSCAEPPPRVPPRGC